MMIDEHSSGTAFVPRLQYVLFVAARVEVTHPHCLSPLPGELNKSNSCLTMGMYIIPP
jgi:hypothetical protein